MDNLQDITMEEYAALRAETQAAKERAVAEWRITEVALRAVLQRIKNSPTYTVEMGRRLGIEPKVQSSSIQDTE